jgi:hypothetical protein
MVAEEFPATSGSNHPYVGDMLDELWRICACGGTMVELVKKDILSGHPLSMEPFGRNYSFRGIYVSPELVSPSTVSS